jgi:hypothetical protein
MSKVWKDLASSGHLLRPCTERYGVCAPNDKNANDKAREHVLRFVGGQLAGGTANR